MWPTSRTRGGFAFSTMATGLRLHQPEEQLVSPSPHPPRKGALRGCAHAQHGGCVGRARPSAPPGPWLSPAPIPAIPRPRTLPSSHSPRERSLRLPLCCPDLSEPRARHGPPARSRALVTTSRRCSHWSARGWRGSRRGRGSDQLFPELHNNKRTRTGRRPPGHDRSTGAGPPLPQRRSAHVSAGGRAAVGAPSRTALPARTCGCRLARSVTPADPALHPRSAPLVAPSRSVWLLALGGCRRRPRAPDAWSRTVAAAL